jgi:hypothetical protein
VVCVLEFFRAEAEGAAAQVPFNENDEAIARLLATEVANAPFQDVKLDFHIPGVIDIN